MTTTNLLIRYQPWGWPETDVQPICPRCKDTAPVATMGLAGPDYHDITDHRWCLIHGFEDNQFQSKQEWIDACVAEGRKRVCPTKVIARGVKRKVLLEDLFTKLSVSQG